MISIGDPADPPVRLASHQADIITATLAAGSSLIALAHRDRSGRGQHVDVSSLEAMAAITHIAGVGKWLEDGVVPKRVGTGLVASVPSGAYRCKDGLVYLMVNRPAHWEALAKWIHERTGNEEVLLPDFRGPSSNRLPFRELLDLFIGDLTEQLTVGEAYHEGQRRHIAFTPVNTAARILADEHLAARGFFETLELEDGRRLRSPGAPYRFARTPWRIERPVPAPGAHQREVLESADRIAVGANVPHDRDAPALPLAGLRVVEFGTGLAAPYTSFSYLKELPGDLLKIDGSFIVNMNEHPANIAIVEAIVNLARNLGMKTVAEWAEDTETVETLAEIGVDYVQGFAVARPQPPEKLLTLRSSADLITDPELLAFVDRVETGGAISGMFVGSVPGVLNQ